MSVILSHASTVVHALIAMALTSAPALMALQASTARIWYDGAICHRVRMGDRAGRKELRTPVNVRLGGLVSTATSPVCPVK